MKRILMGAVLLAALGGSTLLAQDRDDWGWQRAHRNDLRHDYRDRRNDWCDIHGDKAAIAHDRAELRHDYAVGNYAAARRERQGMKSSSDAKRQDVRGGVVQGEQSQRSKQNQPTHRRNG